MSSASTSLAETQLAAPLLEDALTLPGENERWPDDAPPSSSGVQGQPAEARLKHYDILRLLGQGGMGSVFLARDTRLGRLVAIKVLQQHSDQSTQRFLTEARATARCRHENIVVIYDVDEFEGSPYMVLEYLEGRTLRDWLVRLDGPDAPGQPYAENVTTAPVSPGLSVELMVPVVRALACAHQQGIVHRDLKPANIVLTDAGAVKVVDFGIAKRVDIGELAALSGPDELLALGAGLTRSGALLGTLPYMAPEQWLNGEIDARTDLWAVGIIFFRLVVGAHPLAPISWGLQLATVGDLSVPMPSVLERRPDLGRLGSIIDRCLKKPKAERFGSANDLLEALEALTRVSETLAPAPVVGTPLLANAGFVPATKRVRKDRSLRRAAGAPVTRRARRSARTVRHDGR